VEAILALGRCPNEDGRIVMPRYSHRTSRRGFAADEEGRTRVIVNPDDLSCKELVELVTDYVEDKLPASVRTRFEMHLSYCAPCRIYLAQMRETVKLAGRLSEEALPPRAKEALLAAFRGWHRGDGGEG
jgi:hypothetical protein